MNNTSTKYNFTFFRDAGKFTLASVISRVLGYVRDAMLMFVFGAGAFSDAFYGGFRIINLIRKNLNDGILNLAVLPQIEKDSQDRTNVTSAIWVVILNLSIALAIFSIFGANWIIKAITYGFVANEYVFKLSVLLFRILTIQFVFMTSSALFRAILNSQKRFFLPTLLSTLFSAFIILYLLAVSHTNADMRQKIIGVAIASVLGAAVQFSILFLMAKKNINFKCKYDFKKAFKTLSLVIPAFVCIGSDQLCMIVETIFASSLKSGSVTAIFNTSRLIQLPSGLLAIALGNVSIVYLSKKENLADTISNGVKTIALIMIPASFAMAFFGLEIVRTLFEHGKFAFSQSEYTYTALLFAAPAIFAHSINKFFAMSAFAKGYWKSALKIGVFQIISTIVLCKILIGKMTLGGLTMSSTISAFLASGLYAMLLIRKSCLDVSVFKSFLKPIIASLVMIGFCFWLRELMAGFAAPIMTFAIVIIGAAVYFISAYFLKTKELSSILSSLKRGNG
jgi:putative peptidoglycan lipid II flippase